uniref:Uncharacterized protein n=1 Tax=Kalanchoe fedtschenkoi TaxID=63787 RepID=A0A7N0U016_KALFE
MGKDGNCSKNTKSKHDAPLRKIQIGAPTLTERKQSKGKETDASSSSLAGNARSMSLLEMTSILSTLVGRQLRAEEIKVISEDPMKTKVENLMLKNNSLCDKLKTLSSLRDQFMSMRKREAELKQLEESRQHEGKGWWEVNVGDLKTVEEVKEVAVRAAEFQNLLVDHLNNLKMNSADKKDASSSG